MKKNVTLIILLFIIIISAHSQQKIRNYNTVLFDTLNPSPPKNAQERYSALWGYTSKDGREYALLGGYNGTHIIDISDKPIKQVAFIPGTPSGWRELKAVNGYAYVVTEGSGGNGDGLQIIDLTKLPTSATLVKNDTSLYKTAHTISQEGSFIYVHGTQAQAGVNGGTFIYDVSIDPINPKIVGKWTGRYVHDAIIKNDTMYCSAINDGRLDIVYLGKDRKNPQFVTDIRYPGAGTHNSDLTVNSKYIMTTDEVGTTAKTLKIWDRSDINNISKVTDWTPSLDEIIHNVHTKGDIAVIAWYTAGTRIVDISDPIHPAEIGYYDTYLGPNGGYSGNWETYPYFKSGKIIASDMQNGLYVFNISKVIKGSINGVVTDAVTKLPIANVPIIIPKLGKQILSDNQGRYSYYGAIDTLNFNAAVINYFPTSGKLNVTKEGNIYNIEMTQMALSNYKIVAIDGKTKQDIPKFSFRVINRPEYGNSVDSQIPIYLPKDSLYQIYVGAWGFNSELVSTTSSKNGIINVTLNNGYFDDAELDFGWSFTDSKDKGVLISHWEKGVPIRTRTQVQGRGLVEIQPGEDHSAKFPFQNNAFITGIAGSESGAGTTDIDSGTVTLTSPIMDLSSYTTPVLNCWLWYSRDGNVQNSPDDSLKIYISNDGGVIWNLIDVIADSHQKWFEKSYNIKKFVNQTSQTQFRIVGSDLGNPSLVEAGMDDFSVSDLIVKNVDNYRDDTTFLVKVLGNPVAQDIIFEMMLSEPQQNATIEIYNITGERVLTSNKRIANSGRSVVRVPASELQSGAYNYVIKFINTQVTGKFIKE